MAAGSSACKNERQATPINQGIAAIGVWVRRLGRPVAFGRIALAGTFSTASSPTFGVDAVGSSSFTPGSAGSRSKGLPETVLTSAVETRRCGLRRSLCLVLHPRLRAKSLSLSRTRQIKAERLLWR